MKAGWGGTRPLELAGLAAAIVLAVLVNVLAARHFTRWDWTQHKRWSISPATLETLHAIYRRTCLPTIQRCLAERRFKLTLAELILKRERAGTAPGQAYGGDAVSALQTLGFEHVVIVL